MGMRMPCLVGFGIDQNSSTDRLTIALELLALYKEVQQQYDSGRLEVPDDVTLLFADDNFGTIRRLPHGEEAERKGGAGARAAPISFVDIANSERTRSITTSNM
jgi:hypothetical protein